MNKAGISEDNWTVLINGKKLSPTTQLRPVSYGKDLDVSLKINYKWSFSDKVFTKESLRTVKSAFKVRNYTNNSTTIE